MKVAVLGASGLSGRNAVRQALDRGWNVVAIVRSPEKMSDVQHEQLQVKTADVFDVESMTSALEGCDAVIGCLGASGSEVFWRKPITLYSESTKVITDAMRRSGVKRLVVISSWCTKDIPGNPKMYTWVYKPLFLGRLLKDMADMEDYLSGECADIDYTCVRTPGLNNLDMSEKILVAVEGQYVPNAYQAIPRADVVSYMLKCVETDQTSGKCMAIGLVA